MDPIQARTLHSKVGYQDSCDWLGRCLADGGVAKLSVIVRLNTNNFVLLGIATFECSQVLFGEFRLFLKCVVAS